MTLSDAWAEFSSEFLPHHTPEWQVKAIRIAFYAGAGSSCGLISDNQPPETIPSRGEMVRTIKLIRDDVIEASLAGVDGGRA